MSNTHNIAVLAGDGIGPEVTAVALETIKFEAKKFGFELNLTDFPQSGAHYLKTGEVLHDETVEKLKEYDAIYLGAVGHPDVAPGVIEKGLLLKLRFALDQYINLRPVKLYPGVDSPLKDATPEKIDYICVRENTGGLYTGIGGFTMKGTEDEVAVQSMVYNRKQVERCLRYAFELAQTRPRKTLAMVGKTNVLTYVFDLWQRTFEELAPEYPDVKTEYYHVDAVCMFMIKTPEKFDVMVTCNMFGDIVTDLGAETQGGMGMAASGNINPSKKVPSMFEPVHGSAPDIAGQNKANPIAAIMSGRMMIEFLGETEAAAHLDKAIAKFTETQPLTLSTTETAEKFMEILASID
ncbi:MAG: 3-isopropylmalate dehydrogenase [Lentisphaeraceae bacterium]|nr:3-isopropylmalate dehydrogenase [Lentisphaeraceae bacterium]